VASGSAVAQNVTQGYASDQQLQNGMIVRLKKGNAKKVEALKADAPQEMLGVVVASTGAPLSISDPTTSQTYVATFGKYMVLVSDQNGNIKTGDYITISAVDGVGMKADGSQQLILGKALNSFSTKDGDSTLSVTDTAGNKRTVALKRIGVDISVSRNPIYSGDIVAGVPNVLSKAAQLVTKKPVTALRIYACLAVLALSLIVAGMIIYSGVKTGMTAVGRNPLAKTSIVRNMIAISLMAIVIVLIGVIAVYLLLKI
jgi:F0F1-type ATP synthase membrane subunit c/vacuolar-type H+-ATPase subunit K